MDKPSPFLSFASKNSIELINELQINFFFSFGCCKTNLQDIWKDSSVFWCTKWKHSDVICAGILRDTDSQTMVGSI